jgi:hypothetical protein
VKSKSIIVTIFSFSIGLLPLTSIAKTKNFCMTTYTKYLNAKVPHKAFATSSGTIPTENPGSYACSSFWNTNLQIAVKKSLDGCQKQAKLHHETRVCRIVAKE